MRLIRRQIREGSGALGAVQRDVTVRQALQAAAAAATQEVQVH